MPLESASYIGGLNAANPTASDPKSDGDDHLRMIKGALLASFAGFTGAILITGTDGGVSNAYTITPPTALAAYAARMIVNFSPVIANSGACTLNVSGLGAKPLRSVTGAELVGGDLTANAIYHAVYTGTEFRLLAVTKNYMDQLVVSGTVPGVNDPANAGKVFSTTGSASQWVGLDSRGDPFYNNGTVASGTATISYTNGDGQKITAAGAHTLTAGGFPAGRLAGVLLELTNYGAYTITTTGITWIKSDGTETTNFAASGITLASAGRSRVVLYSMGDGTIYGKSA